MAHDEDDPISAVHFVPDHLEQDINGLVATTPDLKVAVEAIPAAKKLRLVRRGRSADCATREIRQKLGIDSNQAMRFVSAGVESKKETATRCRKNEVSDEMLIRQLSFRSDRQFAAQHFELFRVASHSWFAV